MFVDEEMNAMFALPRRPLLRGYSRRIPPLLHKSMTTSDPVHIPQNAALPEYLVSTFEALLKFVKYPGKIVADCFHAAWYNHTTLMRALIRADGPWLDVDSRMLHLLVWILTRNGDLKSLEIIATQFLSFSFPQCDKLTIFTAMEYGHSHMLGGVLVIENPAKAGFRDVIRALRMEHSEIQTLFLQNKLVNISDVIRVGLLNECETDLYWLHNHPLMGPVVTALMIKMNVIEDVVIYGM